MNLLRIFAPDYDNIDEQNFINHKKKFLISTNNSVIVEVVNKNNLSRELKISGQKKVERRKNEFVDIIKLKNGSVLIENSSNFYLRFQNDFEYEKYFNSKKWTFENSSEANIDLNNLCLEIDHQIRTKAKFDNNILLLFDLTNNQKTLNLQLRELDKKFNKYLFDQYFLHLYFVQIVILVGDILSARENAMWEYSETHKRNVLRLNKGRILDFIPILYREMLRQKYTGFCSIEAIISGLQFSSNTPLNHDF